MAAHARTRFHFIAKNPAVNAGQPDPNLWIVHYHQTEPHRAIPVAQIPIQQHMRQAMNERQRLEAQGRLDKRDFMLHDREHWPSITVPFANAHMQQAMQAQQQQQLAQGMYQNNQMLQQQMAAAQAQRYSQQHAFPQPHQGGPPAKRPRTSGPGLRLGSSDGAQHHLDNGIEEEEEANKDYFDYLTPRDISRARFIQHHQWMEQVFNSPYASSQIVPPDLGLGLMGELKGLTKGILEPPKVEDISNTDEKKVSKNGPREAQPFTNLRQEQLEEFNTRVEKHLQESRQEIESMKRVHEERMREWKKGRMLVEAEKKLRTASWSATKNGSALPAVYRFDATGMNGHSENGNSKGGTVEGIVEEVETALGVRFREYKDAELLQSGGLEKEDAVAVEQREERQDMQNGVQNGALDMQQGSYQPQPPVAMPQQVNGSMQPQQQQPQQTASQYPSMQQPSLDQQPSFNSQQQGIGSMEFDADMGDGDSLVDLDMNEVDEGMGGMDTGGIEFLQPDEDDEEAAGNSYSPAALGVATDPVGASTMPSSLPLETKGLPMAEPSQAPEANANSLSHDAAPVDMHAAGSAVTEATGPQQGLQNDSIDEPAAADVKALNMEPQIPAEVEPAEARLSIPALGMAEPHAASLQPATTAPVPDTTGNVDNAAIPQPDPTADQDLFGDGTFDDLADMAGGTNEIEADGDDTLVNFGAAIEANEAIPEQGHAFGKAMHGFDDAQAQ